MGVIKEALIFFERNHNALFYPVGRKLMACTLMYMAGIVCASLFTCPVLVCIGVCAILALVIVYFRRTGRRLLLPVCLVFFVTGVAITGIQLGISDVPTASETPISGTISSIESDYRVKLDDVRLSDKMTTNRPVIVTLMNEDAELLPMAPSVGQRVSGTGRLFLQDAVRNPGGVDRRISALCDEYELSGYLLPGWTADGAERFSFAEAFRRLRLSLLDRLTLYFGEDASLFAALMLGEKGDVDPELKSAMQLTGTAHILSVSGMHLTMVSSAVYALLNLLPIGMKVISVIQAIVLLLFTGLTGAAVGTVRALLMQFMRLIARVTGRRYDPLTSLSFSALVILAASPLMVFDAGFQFSFFVVFGIQLLMDPIRNLPPLRWLSQHARWLAEMMAVSLSAQIAALPMQLSLYGYVPLLALPMNLLASILIPFLMLGGWVLLLVGFILPAAASKGAEILALAERAFEAISLWAAHLRGGILRLPSPASGLLAVFGAAMALISPKIRFGRCRYRAFITVLLCISALYLPRLDPALRYVQLDVGQGDASLIRSGRHAVVVDAGPAGSYDLIRYLRHEGLVIDGLVFSHLDEDHAGALDALSCSEIGLDRVVMAEGALEDVDSEAVLAGIERLEQNGVSIEFVQAGDSFSAMEMHFSVLSPDASLKGSNERSLLLQVQAADVNLLLCGDLPKKSEPDVVPACDVLKVAHHGSKNASSAEFLKQASPQIAVISVGGNNSYGHPHERVLGDLEAVGARVYRTDQTGCVTIWLEDGLRTDTFLEMKEKGMEQSEP